MNPCQDTVIYIPAACLIFVRREREVRLPVCPFMIDNRRRSLRRWIDTTAAQRRLREGEGRAGIQAKLVMLPNPYSYEFLTIHHQSIHLLLSIMNGRAGRPPLSLSLDKYKTCGWDICHSGQWPNMGSYKLME